MRRARIARMVLLFILIAPILVFLFGSLVMWLWNNALVPVLHVSTVTFWQALGILVLAKILFSSFGGRGRSNWSYMKQRMMWRNMTPEQKEKFREEWKNRCGRGGYKSWDAETDVEPGTSGS